MLIVDSRVKHFLLLFVLKRFFHLPANVSIRCFTFPFRHEFAYVPISILMFVFHIPDLHFARNENFPYSSACGWRKISTEIKLLCGGKIAQGERFRSARRINCWEELPNGRIVIYSSWRIVSNFLCHSYHFSWRIVFPPLRHSSSREDGCPNFISFRQPPTGIHVRLFQARSLRLLLIAASREVTVISLSSTCV